MDGKKILRFDRELIDNCLTKSCLYTLIAPLRMT